MTSDDQTGILTPDIHPSVFIAEGARIYGDVVIGEGSSVWFNAVIRGDEGKIRIGRNTNIQDNVVVHTDDGAVTTIGDNVTIGHGAVIRGCRIGHHAMIGMNATVMSHADIGDHSIIGANAMVPYNAEIEPGSLAVGTPAKKVRSLAPQEYEFTERAVSIYADLVGRYQDGWIVPPDRGAS